MRIAKDQLTEPVGRYVTPVQSVIGHELTVAEALVEIRRLQIQHTIVYFYVVDEEQRLVGVVPTRRLLMANPETPIRSIMIDRVISVTTDMRLEFALELFAMHRLLALPAVDAEGKLVGVIDVQLYAEEAADLAEISGDLFQVIGLHLEQARKRSAFAAYRLRMPWLACNMIGGLGCAMIALAFEATLEAVVVLAMFIPLVLTLAESISMQSMALSLPFLHLGRVPMREVWRRAGQEWPTALLLGLTSGLAVGVIALLWGAGWGPPAVIGVTIVITMVVAATCGLGIPLLLHAARLDPKVAAGPVVLMTTDVVATVLYLSLATWWLM